MRSDSTPLFLPVICHYLRHWLPRLIILPLVFALGSAGAAPARFLIQKWDSSSGLPHNTVRVLAQTPDGYLWIGTENGLARFDGVRFENFTRENSGALPNPNVEFLQVDSTGVLWVGAKGHLADWNGRQLVDQEVPLANGDQVNWVLFSHTNEIAFATVQGCVIRGHLSATGNYKWTSSRPAGFSQFAVDGHGSIWQLSPDRRLWRMNDMQRERMPIKSDAGQLNQLIADSQGRIWLGTERQLLVQNDAGFSPVAPPPGETALFVTELFSLGGGTLGVVANGKFWRLENGRWQPSPDPWPSHQLPLIKLLNDREGNAWFSRFGDGLMRLGADGHLLNLSDADGLPVDRVRCLMQDHEGNLWLGIDRGGLIRLRTKQFQVLDTSDGLSDPVVLGLCEDREGAIWASTYGGGLDRWLDGRFTRFDFGNAATPDYVFTVFPDHAGRLWVGTRDSGVYIREGGEFRSLITKEMIPLPTRAIFEDHQGTIWLGSGGGVFCWKDGKLEHFAADDPDLGQADVRGFAEDSEGALWICTHGSGLHRFKGQQHVAMHVADGLPNEFIRSIYADKDGAVWVGMYGGGLLRWKNGKLAAAAPSRDLPDDVICQFGDDGAGQFWIGTDHGLFRVAKSELNAYADGKKKNVACIVYGKNDGLPDLEFSGGIQPSCWRAHDGQLWFATDNGLFFLQPATVTVNTLPPPVAMESLLVDGQIFASSLEKGESVQDIRKDLQVPAGRTQFEFRYTGLSYTAPDSVRFQYRLENLQQEWIDAGMNRTATYNYLPPGEYTFHVRAANNDGVWNDTGATVSFQLLPHFWQRWWFRTLMSASIIGLVWLAYYLRMLRLRELERLRLRIARDLHDDVGANLASMALIAEAMQRQPAFGDPSDLQRIAVQTIDALRDIVWFIDPARDRLGDLVTRMRDTAPLLLPAVKYTFETIVPNPDINVPPSFRRHVFPLFKEVLHNVASHARAGRVEITLDCRSGVLRLKVRDDGIGFDEKQIVPGNGLRNFHRRAAEIHGAVRIVSGPGQGTTVEFEAPFPQTRGFLFNFRRLN